MQEENPYPYKDECRFPHDFPDILGTNAKQALEMWKEIEKKIAIYVSMSTWESKCAGKEKDEGCQLAVEPEHIIVHPDL